METEQPNYSIGWQGGEPTLMGVDFFREVVNFQKSYGRPGAIVSNGLQTNATLIDDEFAEFFGEYKFLIGVSIDGPEELHDVYRRNATANGTHTDVLRGIDALARHKVEYNALILVSSANVEHPRTVYRYLVDNGMLFHQYIPCVEFDDNGAALSYTITAEQWGKFLIGIYDEWVQHDTRRVSVRDFDAVIGQMVTGQYSMCVQGGKCTSYFVVEHNGDVYPCDFFVERSKRIGSVLRESWADMQQSRKYESFGGKKSEWNEACVRCPYLRYCSGDCLKQRFHSGRDSSALSWLCAGWQDFYRHTIPEFEKLALSVLNERQRYERTQPDKEHTRIYEPKVGWNDPCYCGSGKKFRLCHGQRFSI